MLQVKAFSDRFSYNVTTSLNNWLAMKSDIFTIKDIKFTEGDTWCCAYVIYSNKKEGD